MVATAIAKKMHALSNERIVESWNIHTVRLKYVGDVRETKIACDIHLSYLSILIPSSSQHLTLFDVCYEFH